MTLQATGAGGPSDLECVRYGVDQLVRSSLSELSVWPSHDPYILRKAADHSWQSQLGGGVHVGVEDASISTCEIRDPTRSRVGYRARTNDSRCPRWMTSTGSCPRTNSSSS